MFLFWYWWLPAVCYVCFAVAAILAFRRNRRWTMLVFCATAILSLAVPLYVGLLHLSESENGAGIIESIVSVVAQEGVEETYHGLMMFGYTVCAVAGLVEIARLRKLSPQRLGTDPFSSVPRKPAKGLGSSGFALILAICILGSGAINQFSLLDTWIRDSDIYLSLFAIVVGAIGSIFLLINRRVWLAVGITELTLVFWLFLAF